MKVESLKKDLGAPACGKKRKNDGHCRRCKIRQSLTLHQCQVLLLANNYYRHRCPVFITTEDVLKPGKLRAGRVALNMKIKGSLVFSTMHNVEVKHDKLVV